MALNPNVIGVTSDQLQARQLPMPKGDMRLPDGRKLREIIGYRENSTGNPLVDEVTRKAMIVMRGWQHTPSGLVISASIAKDERFDRLLHVAISYPDHDPTWEEIKVARAIFYPPDVDVMMVLPRASNYVNRHTHCFHLWQTPTEWTVG